MAKIIPLMEGSFTVDASKEFVPFDTGLDDLQQRNRGSILVEIQPFLLITANDYILLDTGLGFRTPQGNLQLHQNLINEGINPSDITKVLLSHLHKDHSGGLMEEDESTGERVLSFPEATYYINRDEFAYGMENDGKSYRAKDFAGLQGNPQLMLTGKGGNIDNYIQYEVTGAHCPHHQVFWIKDEADTYFYGGDVAPQLSQMKNRFIAKYDFDGRKCMELRQEYLKIGTPEKWFFLFYHDISTPYFQF